MGERIKTMNIQISFVNSKRNIIYDGINRYYEIQFRCGQCDKLLAKENANKQIAGQIKCPRCGIMNER